MSHEDDEWRRRATSCGSHKKWLGVLTECRQLFPLIASLGGRLHRAADTCPVRLALHMCGVDLGTGGEASPFGSPPHFIDSKYIFLSAPLLPVSVFFFVRLQQVGQT